MTRELRSEPNTGAQSDLGAYLVAEGHLSEHDLAQATQILDGDAVGLGPLLIRTGMIGERELACAYAELLALPRLDYSCEQDCSVQEMLPLRFRRESFIVPIAADLESVTLAVGNPLDAFAIESARMFLGRPVKLAVAEYGVLKRWTQETSDSGDPSTAIEVFRDTRDDEYDLAELRDSASEAPVVVTVNALLADAITAGASDVHVEPVGHDLRVRFRVDGVLHRVDHALNARSAAVVSRIKMMAGMDIAEHRLPQDGRARFRFEGRTVDLRLATYPTIHGESVAIRLLDAEGEVRVLDDIGFASDIECGVRGAIREPNGVMLITGPTGSGKTTTLYAILREFDPEAHKILTVEDPVEYDVPGVNQLQVKTSIGLDFARALRSIVRQDPDVILIGEIRDLETAEIGIRSALTGHYVLSTLHTNDAASSITRLLDMGVEPFLITSTVRAIMAQRLIRKLCTYCRRKVAYRELASKAMSIDRVEFETAITYAATGCEQCRDTGYAGRLPVAELMLLDEAINGLVADKAQASAIQDQAMRGGMRRLLDDGVRHILSGETSVEEVLRVLGEGR